MLDLPTTVEAWAPAPDILHFKGVIPWGAELITLAERLGAWRQSTQVQSGKSGAGYTNDFRTSHSVYVDARVHADYRPFEQGLANAFHSCVRYYKQYNEFLDVTDDTRYELLRYQTGQRFGLHQDVVLGRNEAARQLSGVAYLNDDYQGGELYFPRQVVKLKPRAGDIVLFPSNFCFPHESLPVTAGVKYACVTWFVAYPHRCT